jgi:3-hydroxybutyryl-CoA dehydrogenase
MPEFKRAVVIGTGMMGPGIAATFALGGLRTTVLSRDLKRARTGREKALSLISLLAENDLAEPEAAREAESLLLGSIDMDAEIRSADIVVESAPEDMEFKQELFRHLDEVAAPHTVLASNTSGLSITAIASLCTHHPERVLTTHFWNPPHLMPLVEIVCGKRTSPEIAESVRTLMLHCGKVPVIVWKDRPGQLGNRLHQAVIREAVNVVAEGIASVEDVDLAVRKGFGMRFPVYGIFEHQDLVGLDLASKVVEYVAQDLYNEPHAPPLYQELMAAGHFGVSTGRGFYDWKDKSADGVKSRRDRFLMALLKSEFGE